MSKEKSRKMSHSNTTLGDRLCIVRKKRGLSQKEVGELMGLPWRRYQTWETGARRIGLENLTHFSRLFGVRIEWLIDGELPMNCFAVAEIVNEVVAAIANELAQQNRTLSSANWGLVASKMVASRLQLGKLNAEEMANYVELAGVEEAVTDGSDKYSVPK